MPIYRNKERDDKVGHIGRFLAFAMGIVALFFSYKVNQKCDFFTYEVEAESAALLPSPYDTVGATGSVGLFSSATSADGACTKYPHKLLDLAGKDGGDSEFNVLFIIAQICAPIATVTAFLALFISVIEWCFCSCCCSLALDWSLYLGACLAQGATFLAYGQKEFCFADYSEGCKFGQAGVYSVVAAALFYIISVMLCCFPHPTPLMDGLRDKAHE